MRVVIQRVSKASVSVESKVVGEIKKGLLVLVGIEERDESTDADWLAQKITQMRIFEDAAGKMNASLLDIEGELLIISQFTLHALTKKGNRPSFIKAAPPDKAIPLYEYLIEKLSALCPTPVQKGIFGTHMEVMLINDGPVTITMDSHSKE